MMKLRILGIVATTITICAVIGQANGQENLPFGPSNYEQDLQMFAPFELDLDNMVDDQWSGYSFEYNKLFWNYTGERVTVGSPNVFVTVDNIQVNGEFAEIIYRDNPQDEGDPPPPYVVQNTLTDVAPNAGFAMGNRYEIGYRDNGHGWQIGVLDGPKLHQTQFFGFVPDPTIGNGLPPFIDDDYTDGTDIGPGTGPTADGDLRAFGWGSVPILFETPPGYLVGFRDYLNILAGAAIGTQGGPMLYVGNYGATSEADDDEDIPFFRLADDIDEDGTPGAGFVLDPDGNIILLFTDFDDLHTFNVFFDSVLVRNVTRTDGVEAMWTHDLTNQHHMAKHKNNRLTASWGARFLQLYDQFRIDAEGSLLGRSNWDTSFTNNVVGPQVGLQWVNQRQRWRLQSDARFLFGYNIANWDQIGLMGEELIPGALNRPLYARPTAFSHGLREQEFSPVGELRVHASYHFTRAFALNFGYTGSYLGNIRRAAPSVRYRLPDFGYVDTGGENILINGFDLGVEFRH
jgi:hypothetical protein